MLRNASGLTWIGPGQLLFSEMKGCGIHMAIVLADEARHRSKDIYVPPTEKGMAHRSYVSPDGRWICWQRWITLVGCRAVWFHSTGARVVAKWVRRRRAVPPRLVS